MYGRTNPFGIIIYIVTKSISLYIYNVPDDREKSQYCPRTIHKMLQSKRNELLI